jgi:hypothetical protein
MIDRRSGGQEGVTGDKEVRRKSTGDTEVRSNVLISLPPVNFS